MGLTNSNNYDYDNDGLLPPLSREEAIEQSLILSDLVDKYSFGEAGSIFDWGKVYRY